MAVKKLWEKKHITAIENFVNKTGQVVKIKNADLQSVIDETADLSDKNINELRCKLVDLGYYQVVAKTSAATGKAPVRKLAHVKAAEIMLGLAPDALSSFEKASKPQLEAMVDALKLINDKINADAGIKEPAVTKAQK